MAGLLAEEWPVASRMQPRRSQLPAIGASGAIMAVMMLYVIFYPFEQFRLFWFLAVPLWALLGGYMLYDLHPVLLALAGDQMFSGVAHASHLGGLAFGFLTGGSAGDSNRSWTASCRPGPAARPVRSANRLFASLLGMTAI